MIVKCNLFYTILFWKTFNDTLLVGSMTWPLLLKCCSKKIQDKALPFAQQLLTLFLFFAHFVRRVALNGCFLLKKVWSKYKHEPTGTARRFNMCMPASAMNKCTRLGMMSKIFYCNRSNTVWYGFADCMWADTGAVKTLSNEESQRILGRLGK